MSEATDGRLWGPPPGCETINDTLNFAYEAGGLVAAQGVSEEAWVLAEVADALADGMQAIIRSQLRGQEDVALLDKAELDESKAMLGKKAIQARIQSDYADNWLAALTAK